MGLKFFYLISPPNIIGGRGVLKLVIFISGLETSYFYFLIGMVWNMLLLPMSTFSCHGDVAQSVERLLKVPVLCNSTVGSNHERDRSSLSLG